LYESLGVDEILDLDQIPEFDLYVPLRTLPNRLGFELEGIPREVPYLKTPADRAARWAERVVRDGKKNVGLVWAGSDATLRSNSVNIFAPLARVSGVRWFSLQMGQESTQRPPAGMEWVDLTTEIQDFADTAAIMERLDLLITVDTSTAHLAGALGKPVWILLPRIRHFFWMMDGDRSSWYPTARLFGQEKMGDWETPVLRMAAELEKWV
jgi:hypothetical protein